MEKEISGFTVDYEVDAGKSFLVLKEDDPGTHEIVGFQIEMIAKNKIPGVAGMNLRERDLEKRLYYDISGLISLANFFKRQKVTKADFIKILQNITGTLTGCKNFLLNDKCFVISENLIFVNPESKEVSLIYIPCHSDADVVALFKSFIVNLVIKTANIETDDNFVQKLLGLIKEEHMCISEFNAEIRRAEGTLPSEVSTEKHQANIEQKSDMTVIQESPEAREELPVAKHKQAAQVIPVILLLLTIVAAAAVKIGRILAETGSFSGEPRFLWGFGAALCAIILFIGGMLYMKFREYVPEVRIKGRDAGELKSIETGLYINRQETAVTAEDGVCDKNSSVNIDETVVLSGLKQPVLVGIGEEESITISKADFVIGRNLDTCDYAIRNKSIGRAHARILNIDGKFYIFDLDSKNGTFLNGSRLISNKQYELNPNDKVLFANLQFCFKIE